MLHDFPLVQLRTEFDLRVAEHFAQGDDRARIAEAVDLMLDLHKDQKRASGEPYAIHPLQVAAILVSAGLDRDTVIAGLLHDVLEDTPLGGAELSRRFGPVVLALVDGVTKIHILHAKTKSVQEAETIRKMFFAMVKDIRVILIKLADKVHNMSTLQHLPEEKARRIAQECLDIYAPLAGRLGLFSVKSQLEDLALKTLDRDAYYQIKDFVVAKRDHRDAYLSKVKDAITREAAGEGIDVKVDARAKHFYSIYSKWKKKGGDLSEVFDTLGVRIYCTTPVECYTLLGLVHRLWKPIEGRFKDYIAMPKDNGYQSLHTTVMGYEGKLTEIQIRTQDMHSTAEFGVAAHWIYKEGKVRPEQLSIVNRLKNWQSEEGEAGPGFLDAIKNDLLRDSIYVFTPKGQVIELPAGATALDFAFAIHTEVGLHTFAAKADGNIVPLGQELKNTQVIEVLTNPNAHPNTNWLRIVRSARARQKIRHWLTHDAEGLHLDKSVVVKKKAPGAEAAAAAAAQQAAQAAAKAEARGESGAKGEGGATQFSDASKVGVRMGMERNLMLRFAQCCHPATGDPIVGFVSRGRGLIIHRSDCPNLKAIPGMDERRVEVVWDTHTERATRRFRVTARPTGDLFSEIEGAIRKFKGHLIEGRLTEENGRLFGTFTMELERREDSQKVMKAIRSIPAVLTLSRLDEGGSGSA